METKNLKDTSYWLYTFWNKEEQAKDEYKIFQMLIEDNGFFKANDVKIYNPQLAFILTSKELPVRNMETQIETTINGREYLKTYIEAYKEGEQYFKTESKFAPNTLYETKAKQYVKNQNPTVLNHKTVKEFGYYSGIINKVEEQAKINQLFTPFDKCEHDLPPQPIEVSKYNPDFKPSFFNLKGFELFNYIIDNYDKDGKIKYINIWYFLRYLTENTNGEIVFNFTQDKYKVFIFEKYGIKIKKFTKAEYRYDTKELPILKNIEMDFRKNIV